MTSGVSLLSDCPVDEVMNPRVVMGVRGGYFSEKAVAGRRDDRPAVDGVSWPPR